MKTREFETGLITYEEAMKILMRELKEEPEALSGSEFTIKKEYEQEAGWKVKAYIVEEK